MPAKLQKKPTFRRRTPLQTRARNKVGLILEAAIRLIERGGVDAVTTNRIAEMAGVSIGTLYQYFSDKNAILDALVDREVTALSARVIKAVATSPETRGGRIPAIVRAVLVSYSGRRRAHRLLLERALSLPTVGRLNPLYQALIELLAGEGLAIAKRSNKAVPSADAFVLVHAVSGVLRAVIATENRRVPQDALEASLTRLIVDFVASSR